jgi:hypothetical protein
VWQGMAKPCHPSNSRRCCHLLYHIWETVASIVHKRCQTYILAALGILWMCARVCFGQVHPRVLTVAATPLFLSATLLYISHSSPANLVFRNKKCQKHTNSYKSFWPLKSPYSSPANLCVRKRQKKIDKIQQMLLPSKSRQMHPHISLEVAKCIQHTLKITLKHKIIYVFSKDCCPKCTFFLTFFCDCSPSQIWVHPKFWH